MDSTDIDKPIKNNSPFPMDGWSVDDNGLPFTSVQAALTHYDPAYRGLGKIVLVNDGTGLAMYWFARNLTELDLLIKTPAVAVPGALAITTHPTGGNISVGGNKVFSVAYTGGTPPYEIHWHKDGNAINGQNGLTLTIANAQLAAAGSYRAAISDSTGALVLSNPAVLVVGNELTITTHPALEIAARGETAQLGPVVVSGGTLPLSYAWQKLVNNVWETVDPVTNASSASGMDTNTLSFSGANPDTSQTLSPISNPDEGQYRVRITDSSATPVTVTSTPAALKVFDSLYTFENDPEGDQNPQDDGGTGPTGFGFSAGTISTVKNFAIDIRVDQTGLPNTMVIRLHNSVTNAYDIDFAASYPSIYNGDSFRYTDSTGTIRTGVVTNGNVDFN